MKGLARRGKPDRPARPIEEVDPEFLLQQLHLAAQRWLRHVQAFGGTSEVHFLGDGDELCQLHQRVHTDTFRVSDHP
jgi:hypothetical protein